MCGILGWYGNSDQQLFENSLHLMQHRGPDDFDSKFIMPNYQFGHRRLSIIDLSQNGRQPMSSRDGRYTIVFNGEIYNFKDIQSELVDLGYHFTSDSDTEVLLAAWHAWQEESLTRFIGMFAFAIFDAQNGTTTLVRDRFGIKPLYIFYNEQNFGFASEAKSLLKLASHRPTLNSSSVLSYFSFRYPVTQQSFFEGIEQLAPGHLLRWCKGQPPFISRYYCLAEEIREVPPAQTNADYIEQVQNTFASAVKYRMISDVPVGAYLSGGLDSSGIVAQMRQHTDNQINTYTIGFTDEEFNESKWAEKVAQQCNTVHHELVHTEEEYMDEMGALIGYKDAPLGVPNEVSLHRLSVELKKKITVVLSGEGADEIFGGYGRIFRSADDYAILQKVASQNHSLSSELVDNFRKKYGDCQFGTPLQHFLYMYRYMPLTKQQQLFSQKLFNPLNIALIEQPFESCFDEFKHRSYSDQIMYSFINLHLPGLLQRVDTTTMAASVEARVPFVDHRLVELAFTLEAKSKMPFNSQEALKQSRGLTGSQISENLDVPKYVLKQAFANLLPEDVVYRKKMGFPVPLNKWQQSLMGKTALQLLNGGALMDSGLMNNDTLSTFLTNTNTPSNHADSILLWMFLNLEMFMRRYSPNVTLH